MTFSPRNGSKRLVRITLLAILLSCLLVSSLFAAERKVSVAVFNNPPMISSDAQGNPQGLFVDIVEQIAAREDWTVAYVNCTWAECVEKTRNAQIDLHTSVMHLPKREAFFDFPKEAVFNAWGQLYVHKDSAISGVFDLVEKQVGVLEGGANGKNFIELAEKFEVSIDFVFFKDFDALADALAAGQIVAGAFPNTIGTKYEQSYPLKQTQIVYSPTALKFATGKGTNQDLVATLDRYLGGWKKDRESAYYRMIDKAFGLSKGEKIPAWVWPLVIAGACVLALYLLAAAILILFNRKLQVKVDQATLDLQVRANELAKMNEDLMQRNKELDEFTFVASHDLQEPLRKVVAFSGLLKVDPGNSLSEDAQENFDFLADAASRMKTLVNDLLVLSRSNRRELRTECLALDDCADAALEALAVSIKDTGARILRDNLPVVKGDNTLLTQLYQNLINNALKFNDDEMPEITLTAEESAQGLILGVKDNGIGIAEQYQTQIFTPFKRLHGRSEYSGTGIGLAICRKAIERHEGRLWVDSMPGYGCHFKFTLWNGERANDV